MPPVLTVLAAWTNDWHYLLRRDIYLDTGGPFPVVWKTYGPWFWVFAAYSYPVMITACIIHKTMLKMHTLSRRQAEILALVAAGFTYKEVAAKLFLSEATIKYHMAEILKRLHLQTRRQALAYAREMGLGREE